MIREEKANTGTRFAAALIDGIAACVVSWVPVVGAIISIIYMLVKDGLFEGQSFGKKVMNLQVVNSEGTKANYTHSIKRNLIFALPYVILMIPFLGWAVFPFAALAVYILETILLVSSPLGRRLGDKFADSQVVAYNETEADKM